MSTNDLYSNTEIVLVNENDIDIAYYKLTVPLLYEVVLNILEIWLEKVHPFI